MTPYLLLSSASAGSHHLETLAEIRAILNIRHTAQVIRTDTKSIRNHKPVAAVKVEGAITTKRLFVNLTARINRLGRLTRDRSYVGQSAKRDVGERSCI